MWNTSVDATTKAKLNALFNRLLESFNPNKEIYPPEGIIYKPLPKAFFSCASPTSAQRWYSEQYVFAFDNSKKMTLDIIFSYNLSSTLFNLHYVQGDDNFTTKDL